MHAITVHPANPEVVFIGTTKGVFRSADRGGRWARLALPDPEADIWSITVDPTDCRTVYAGCGPVGVYRSEDDGDYWKKLPDPGLPDRVHMTFPCRVLCHEHHRSKRRCGTVREMKEGPSGSAIRSLIPSHRNLLWSKVTVVSVAETPGR